MSTIACFSKPLGGHLIAGQLHTNWLAISSMLQKVSFCGLAELLSIHIHISTLGCLLEEETVAPGRQ
jgi:hypothetical protein